MTRTDQIMALANALVDRCIDGKFDGGDFWTLRAEVQKLEDECLTLRNRARIDEATGEALERLRNDAERYRWLRKGAYVFGSERYCATLPDEPASLWLLGSTDMTDDGIDAAIDAAIAQERT